jgi:hypothetical protein
MFMESVDTNADSAQVSRPKVYRLPKEQETESKSFALYGALGVIALVILCGSAYSIVGFVNKTQAQAEAKSIANLAPSAGAQPNMINIQDSSGQIVGELAKIPADRERGMEVSTTSNVDSDTGKELLKIIGKY